MLLVTCFSTRHFIILIVGPRTRQQKVPLAQTDNIYKSIIYLPSLNNFFFSFLLAPLFIHLYIPARMYLISVSTLVYVLLLSISSSCFSPVVRKREPFSQVLSATGEWACSKEQLDALKAAIEDAHTYANAAIKALNTPGSEYSIAYRTWFGSSKSFGTCDQS